MKLFSNPFNFAEDIVNDEGSLANKKKIMKSLRLNSALSSISQVSTFMAGILTTTGMAIALPKFAAVIGEQAGLAAALSAVPGIGTALLAAAAVVTVIAVGSNYVASRIWQSKSFDNLELNARSTAHHLVQEIKGNNMCLTEEKAPARADGKSWRQYIQEQKAVAQGQNQSL